MQSEFILGLDKWIKPEDTKKQKIKKKDKRDQSKDGTFKPKEEPKDKESLKLLTKKLKEKDYGEKELFNEFYEICKQVGIENKQFFKAAYLVLIEKEKGPKLAPFILTIGKERVIKLFEGLGI